MLAETPDRRRVVAVSLSGIAVEAVVLAVVWGTGEIHKLPGVTSAIGITVTIVCGLYVGRVAGGVVGVVNAIIFALVVHANGTDVPYLGLPVVLLWGGIGLGTGAAADYLRRRLHESFEALERAHQSAHEVASTLQRSLLPEALPRIPRLEIGTWFRPAGDGTVIGGDFFDVWRVSGDEFGAAIGDVCGKGPSAAAVTALARHTIRTASILQKSPADVLRVCNDAVRRRVGSGRFCTALVINGRPHPDGFEITVACGGHQPPLLIHSSGEYEEVGRPGTLLGIWREIDVSEASAVIRPGESLVLWTDGIPDRRGPGQRFGQARLEAVISASAGGDAAQIADHVGRAARDFAAEAPQDDAAVLVLGVQIEGQTL
jgi:serine phosphatase RsbU (regulator of sigma subunit)